MDSYFDLVGSHQHGVASYEVISCPTDILILAKMVMTSERNLNPCQLVNRAGTRDNWKNPEYHIVAAIR